jgi:hypothetical protein
MGQASGNRRWDVPRFLLIVTVVWQAGALAHAGQLGKSPKAAARLPKGLRFEPVWRQRGDCGPLSLYVLMRLEDRGVSVQEVEKVLPFDPERGCSLADIARAADALDFPTELRFVNPRDLPNVPFPFILHAAGSLETGTGHFLVVVGYSPEERLYQVIDTSYETFRSQTEESVCRDFSGYVLLPKSRFGGLIGSPAAGLILVGAGCILALVSIGPWLMRKSRTVLGYWSSGRVPT